MCLQISLSVSNLLPSLLLSSCLLHLPLSISLVQPSSLYFCCSVCFLSSLTFPVSLCVMLHVSLCAPVCVCLHRGQSTTQVDKQLPLSQKPCGANYMDPDWLTLRGLFMRAYICAVGLMIQQGSQLCKGKSRGGEKWLDRHCEASGVGQCHASHRVPFYCIVSVHPSYLLPLWIKMGKASKTKDERSGVVRLSLSREMDVAWESKEASKITRLTVVADCFQTCSVTEAALNHNESPTAL